MSRRLLLRVTSLTNCGLRSLRRREHQAMVPERGATLGNFGAARISASESWVTVAEGVWNDTAQDHGAEGAVFVARVLWNVP